MSCTSLPLIAFSFLSTLPPHIFLPLLFWGPFRMLSSSLRPLCLRTSFPFDFCISLALIPCSFPPSAPLPRILPATRFCPQGKLFLLLPLSSSYTPKLFRLPKHTVDSIPLLIALP